MSLEIKIILPMNILTRIGNPYFFTEVLSYMYHARMKYISQAEPIWDMPRLFLNEEQVKFLQQQRSELLREILKDYLVNMSFRKDIYVKGGTKIPTKLWREKTQNIKLVLRVISLDKKYKIELPYTNKNANLNPKTIDRLIEILSEKPLTIGELLEDNILNFKQVDELISVVVLLMHSRLIDMVLSEPVDNKNNSLSLNKVVAMEARYFNTIRFFLHTF